MRVLKPGDKVGEYVLDERIGEGRFGEVWRARHALWADRVVAVKVPGDPEYLSFLRREGLLAHEVNHPNVARPLAADLDADPPYLITGFVDGANLDFLTDRDLFPDGWIALIYLDLPFKSQQSYNVLFKEHAGTPEAAQIKGFEFVATPLLGGGFFRVSPVLPPPSFHGILQAS